MILDLFDKVPIKRNKKCKKILTKKFLKYFLYGRQKFINNFILFKKILLFQTYSRVLCEHPKTDR